jgi:hypothetical protein
MQLCVVGWDDGTGYYCEDTMDGWVLPKQQRRLQIHAVVVPTPTNLVVQHTLFAALHVYCVFVPNSSPAR